MVFSHLKEITSYMFMGNVLNLFNHPVAFYITDDIPFEIPRMLSGSYELQDYFQVLVRMDSSKIGAITLCYTMLKITMKDNGEVMGRIQAVPLFLPRHKSQTNLSLK